MVVLLGIFHAVNVTNNLNKYSYCSFVNYLASHFPLIKYNNGHPIRSKPRNSNFLMVDMKEELVAEKLMPLT